MRWFPQISLFIASAAIALHGCNINDHPKADPTGYPTALVDGTYRIEICEGDCRADSHTVSGILVIDSTRTAFSNQTDAMRSYMGSTSGVPTPNYCYFFDPATSNSKGTLFEYDVVAFGEMNQARTGTTSLSFMLGSPDFRYISEIETIDSTSFVGRWRSTLAISGGQDQVFPSAKLHAKRVAQPNSAICFEAVRKFEHMSLQSFCAEFSRKTCEPGDRP
jgi:hypothetical protein